MNLANVVKRRRDSLIVVYYTGNDAPLMSACGLTEKDALHELYQQWKKHHDMLFIYG